MITPCMLLLYRIRFKSSLTSWTSISFFIFVMLICSYYSLVLIDYIFYSKI